MDIQQHILESVESHGHTTLVKIVAEITELCITDPTVPPIPSPARIYMAVNALASTGKIGMIAIDIPGYGPEYRQKLFLVRTGSVVSDIKGIKVTSPV